MLPAERYKDLKLVNLRTYEGISNKELVETIAEPRLWVSEVFFWSKGRS